MRPGDLVTGARSDDLGDLRATLAVHDGSGLPLRECVRIAGGVTPRLAFASHHQDPPGRLRSRSDTARRRPPRPSGTHDPAGDDVLTRDAVSPAQAIQEIVAGPLTPRER